MKKTIAQRITAVCVGSLAIGLLAEPAMAGLRTSTATGGGPNNAADASCIKYNFGTVENTCTRDVAWEWPLVIDRQNDSIPVEVNVTGNNGTIKCRAVGIDAPITQLVFVSGGNYAFNSHGAGIHSEKLSLNIQVPLIGPFVPAGGFLIVQCILGPNGRINGVDWNL